MFFRRRYKGWENLSEAEKAWVEKLNKENVSLRIDGCAECDHVRCLRYVIENGNQYNLREDDIKRVILLAIRHKSVNALKTVLEASDKEGYLREWRFRESLPLDVFEAAAESKSKEIWDILQEWNARPEASFRLHDWQIVRAAVRQMFDTAIIEMLDKAGESRGSLFADALSLASGQSAEHMRFILQYADGSPAAQKALNVALDRASAEGSKEKAELLIASGAAIDHDAGEALFQAGYNNRFEMLDYLLSKGADLAAYGQIVLDRFRERNPHLPAIDYLDGFYQAAVERRERNRLQKERFSLAGPETLAEILPLPSGGTLTILFNFATRQQIILVQEKPSSREKPSLQVINFSDVENYDAVERAAQKLIELGGDAKAAAACRRGKSAFPKQ